MTLLLPMLAPISSMCTLPCVSCAPFTTRPAWRLVLGVLPHTRILDSVVTRSTHAQPCAHLSHRLELPMPVYTHTDAASCTRNLCPAAGILSESNKISGSISREDVAALAIKALLSKKADGKVRETMGPLMEG